MFLIPQGLKQWDITHNIETANAEKESYLLIECKISIGDVYYSGSKSGYGTVYVPFQADWQPGMRYIYTLKFGGGYNKDGKAILQPINFDASVEEWPTDENSTKSDI